MDKFDDVEKEALRHCAPLLERAVAEDLRSMLESTIVIAFAIGAAWATGDAKLLEGAVATLQGAGKVKQ